MATKKTKVVVIKTQETKESVDAFIEEIDDEQKKADSYEIIKMMKKATRSAPKMWGASLIGFGNRQYVSPNTGREVAWFVIGFSPRKAALTLYLSAAVLSPSGLLKKLGKYKTGKGCLYIKSLQDVDLSVLKSMIETSVSQKSN